MTKIAIMQPYLFPYIGYFQMIKAVDKFVFYDDVNFIKQGWINRNTILVNNKDFMFTVPLQKANSFCLIKDTLINHNLYVGWINKFKRTIEQSYCKAPYFEFVKPIIFKVFEKKNNSISELAIESILAVSTYLELKTEFYVSSARYCNKDLEKQERLLDICKIENANHYINALGGENLYSRSNFAENGLKLSFIRSLPISYQQFNVGFVPLLSIIDILMFNSKKEIIEMLDKYEMM